jgi:hypothetical protein
LNVLGEYVVAVIGYWWLVVPGVLMPLPDIYKALHPRGKQLEISRPLRIGIFSVMILAAQFLTYKDSINNLSKVIEEKRELTIQLNAANETVHQKEIELASVKLERDDLKNKVPNEGSLKTRALDAASQYERFFRERAKHQPTCNQTPSMPPEEQRAVIEPCAKYNLEMVSEYQQRLAPNIMAIVEEFRAKGVNVMNIENCAPQGWFCGTSISVQLRAFANRLDAKDNIKR